MIILPTGDNAHSPGRPVVTYGLIAVNVAIFLFVSMPLSFMPADRADPLWEVFARALAEHFGSAYDSPRYWDSVLFAPQTANDLFCFRWGFRPANPSPITLLSSMFLHAGLLHLAGNMLFLWLFGRHVEERLGRLGFLAAYVGTGVIADATHTALEFSSPLPSIGASGAIFGIMGFYFIFFPSHRIRFRFLIPLPRWRSSQTIFRSFSIRSRLVLGFQVIVDNLLPLFLGSVGVAYGAHLGGFATGFIVAGLLEQKSRTGYPRKAPGPPAPSVAQQIHKAVSNDRLDDAVRLYLTATPSQALDVPPEPALAMARHAVGAGRSSSARTIYRNILKRHGSGPHFMEASAGLRAIDRG